MSDPTYATPDEAETAFYAAFEAANPEAMMAVWAMTPAAVECIHPMGPRIVGRDAVETSWRDIFANGPRMSFRLSDVQRIKGDDIAVHVLHENIHTPSAPSQQYRVIATNVYRRSGTGWTMVLHHGTPGETVSRPREPGQALH